MNIDGKTKVLGLIGNPVAHTLSPKIHNALPENAVYVPFLVEDGKLQNAVSGAHALHVEGLNVTVPYKTEVIPILNEIDEMAEQIGAVNTLVRTEHGYKGYNTDYMGFLRELEDYGIQVQGQNFLILGAGGAARAVAFALGLKNAGRIELLNRTIEKAIDIAKAVNLYFNREIVFPDIYEHVEKLPADEYIGVQCTSVGLAPDCQACILPDGPIYDKIKTGIDIIYRPAKTQFMKYVHEHGGKGYNGLKMLFYQGIQSYELFLNIHIEKKTADRVYQSLQQNLYYSRNIILTGFMGSGKTSVAGKLSEQLGIPAVDTDQLIERQEQCSIAQIFQKEGETYFRNLETNVLKDLLQRKEPFILSTGGGMPLLEQNQCILKQIGTVVYLSASVETIWERVRDDTKRPLLKDHDPENKIKKMMKERDPLYKKGADVEVIVDYRNVNEIIEDIMEKCWE